MVDRDELRFVAKVIKRRSRRSSVVLDKDPVASLYLINDQPSTIVEEPLSCLSTSITNSNVHNITRNDAYPCHPLNNNHPRSAYTYSHPRRVRAHTFASVGSVDTFFFDSTQPPLEVFILPIDKSGGKLSLITKSIAERGEQNRSQYSICGRELSINRRISVPQLVFFWETVFLIGTRSARRYAGWGH
ncbi:27275_t:CDS:1 [Dentiscutata erythropus]|uniref:27275_t:CDS:1 n=1 Tax=Dentiscutata erythropus TaxID=1348616 RepID=A0A9N8WDT9_9GLOM|nr:27275_t:CDS:1 [Dentiscutata erythropus]